MLFHRSKSTGQVGVLSGAPKDELERKVFIYRPAKSAGQHASAAVPSYPWKLSFEKKDRWVNPLMGWTSSSDSLAGQTTGNMNFESKDAAIAFADKNGELSLSPPNTSRTILASSFHLKHFSRVENSFGGAERQQSMSSRLAATAALHPRVSAFQNADVGCLQIHKVRVKTYGENYQWEGEADMEGTVKLRTTHK